MVEIIAHRGSSRACLQNTRAAFKRAIDEEADGIELDVHLTADSVVVVHHDFSLATADESHATIEIASAELRRLHRHPLANGELIPTLDEVLELVGTALTVYVEVKA